MDGKKTLKLKEIFFFIVTRTNRPYTALETKRKITFKDFRKLAFISKLIYGKQIFKKKRL